jgi:catechol 2,3-dioxygenase-like lactoylglutathione lyase family enzyme
MLNEHDAVAMIAVQDLKVARRFYEQTLGLAVVGTQGDDVIELKTGNTRIDLYTSAYARTNKATTLAWDVGKELLPMVAELRKKDVPFMHYDDLPGMTRDGDIHTADDVKLAWFRDPDGNILGLMGR